MLLLAFTPCLANDYPIHTKISSSFLMRQSHLTLHAAEINNVPMSIASVLRDYHLESLAHQEGHFDWAALYLTNARHAGQKDK